MTGNAADGTTGSPLRQRMIDQMRIANPAESTRITYIGEIEHLARHYKASPEGEVPLAQFWPADAPAERPRQSMPSQIGLTVGQSRISTGAPQSGGRAHLTCTVRQSIRYWPATPECCTRDQTAFS